MDWIIQNLGTIIIASIVVLFVSLILFYVVRAKNKGKSSCGCGCSNCSFSDSCANDKKTNSNNTSK